jgi:hypothetical protein
MLIIFIIAPAALASVMYSRMLFPALWILFLGCWVVLWRDPTFERKQLWRTGASGRLLATLLAKAAAVALALTLALWLYEPHRLWSLIRERPAMWAIIMVGYPLLSVYPQEVAFRAFFHHRYRPLFRSGWAWMAANALAFGWAHIVLHSWIAMAFCTVGGALLAHTYERTRSVPVVWLEHAAYGCTVFTVGWGWYFWAGALGR